jgi:choline dehydrogenase
LIERLRWSILGKGDPNDLRLVRDSSVGIRYLPMATKNGARIGSRERVLETATKYPDRLVVELDALATRVLLDKIKRAYGVEYTKGARLYRAHANPNPEPGDTRQALASREVILCGGTFNTPQLMMLSGIGPPAELEKHGIPVQVALPGVGSNLQDRYEVGVVNKMTFPEWWILKGATFSAGDPQYEDWKTRRAGVYTTNGVVSAVSLRSFPERSLPDVLCFALLGPFRGYYRGYSAEFPLHRNYLTWCILKAHTINTAGTVTLRSDNPLDPPFINFHYFDEGSDTDKQDLASLVAAVKFVRTLTAPLKRDNLIAIEELPGDEYRDDKQIEEYVKSNAWGHHATGTCKIGPREDIDSVVDSNFQVHGTRGLRIVDASVFPQIPGFFIVTSVYMIGEKAADVITAAALE